MFASTLSKTFFSFKAPRIQKTNMSLFLRSVFSDSFTHLFNHVSGLSLSPEGAVLEGQERRADCVLGLALGQLTVRFMYTHTSPVVLGATLMDAHSTSRCDESSDQLWFEVQPESSF